MGGLRRRADRLAKVHGLERATLVCPVCSEEFVVYSDAPLEYIVAEWTREAGGQSHRETPADIDALFEHEHHPSDFLEKTSGKSWLSREISGIDLGGSRGA